MEPSDDAALENASRIANPNQDDATTTTTITTTINDDDPEEKKLLQKKLYFFMEQLREMHEKLPTGLQTRISLELLTQIANCLLNETIFHIVKNLLEIQHTTEEQLHRLREQIEKKYEVEVEEWKAKLSDQEELEHLLKLLSIKFSKELKETDKKVVATLDLRKNEQQSTLQKAGVPGFFETNDQTQITMQMHLLDFIIRLSKQKFEVNRK